MPDAAKADTPPTRRLAPALLTWGARFAWIGVGVSGWTAIEQLGLEGAAATIVAGIAAAAWIVGVVGLAIPSVGTLTITRIVVPASIPSLALIGASGEDVTTTTVVAGIMGSLIATAIAVQPEFGRTYVQASAYGREDRHLLRTPPSYLLAAVVAWLLVVGAALGATVAFARPTWWLGIVLAVIAATVGAFSWPRWHRLSRRWLVLLPSGVVVHDQLVLAETLMIPKLDVAGLRLAPADTEAADFTGPAGGHAVELLTREPVTAIRAPTPAQPGGSALHLRACLIAPTRPGRALAAAAAYRLPVG